MRLLISHCCRHSAVHGGGQPVREGRELGQGGPRLHQVQELEQGGRAARPDHLAQDPRAVRQGQGGRRLLQGGAAGLHGGQGVRERDPRAAGAPAEPGGRGAHRARAAVDRGRQDGVLTCILRDEDLIFLWQSIMCLSNLIKFYLISITFHLIQSNLSNRNQIHLI